MRKLLLPTTLFFICLTYIQCIPVKYHDYADLNKIEAVELIQRLKKDTLIVVLPTYSKKEALLKLIANNNNGNTSKNKQRLLELYAERQIQLEAFIKSFSEIYTFSPLLYIPDSLVSRFEAGVPGQYFVNSSLRIDSSLNYSNQQPIKLVQQYDQEWQIKIGNDILPNPFPNYYLYRNGLYGFLGNESYKNMYARVATVFQKRFDQFYKNPDRRLYL